VSSSTGAASQAMSVQGDREHVRRMARELIRFNLHPDETVHPSWLPADWPAGHRCVGALGPAGRELLASLLRRSLPNSPTGFDSDFTTTRKRVALLDGPALRQLAWYCGVALHRAALYERPLKRELRRQARRFGSAGAAYVWQRLPELGLLRANASALVARPPATGRTVWRRGARVLLALNADDAPTLARMRLKLPRRLAAGALPMLDAAQRQQLEELVTLSIVPERLPQWDWLF
jgi:type III secretion protein K